MADLTGMEIKYEVLKHDDIDKYLTNEQKTDLAVLSAQIETMRKLHGKETNKHLVINTDEPYADEVIDILKRNGHWG